MHKRLWLYGFLVATLTACTMVDQTEHCVGTRYGKVVENQMDNGLNATILETANCFKTTQQNYPEEAKDWHEFSASTRDPVIIHGKIRAQYHYNEIPKLYLEKRTEGNAEIQMVSALNDAITTAMTKFTMDELFGTRRAELTDSIKAIASRKVGMGIVYDNIFLTDLNPPEAIAAARIQTAAKETQLQAARKQLEIDSVNASAVVLAAKGKSEAARLEAQAIASSPDVLKLRAAEAMAMGLSKACAGASTCIIGGNVLDKFMSIGGGKP